jgi:methylphosphotriester-DNA--protein-cysteine methyltransferase
VQDTGRDKPRLATIAREVGRTARTVRKEFRKAHGVSPRECRARALALRIIEALRSSDLKVTSVAFELGIKSPKNLYLAVKAHTSLTPTQVRRLPPEAFAALRERIRTDGRC